MYFEAGIFFSYKATVFEGQREGLLDVRLGLGLISILKHRHCLGQYPITVYEWRVMMRNSKIMDNADEYLEIKD